MELNVNVESIEAAAAREVADHYCDADRVGDMVRQEVKARLNKIFAETAEAEIASAIKDAIQQGFEKPFQPVDAFGRPDGEPTTVRAKLAKLVEDFWTTRVDRSGNPTSSAYNSTSRAEFVLVQAIGEDFAKSFKQEAGNVAAEIKDGLRAELRKWVDSTLGNLFHVKSATDKAEGRSQ